MFTVKMFTRRAHMTTKRISKARRMQAVAYGQHRTLTMLEAYTELGGYCRAVRWFWRVYLRDDVHGTKAQKIIGHAADYCEANGRVLCATMFGDHLAVDKDAAMQMVTGRK
jgi:hypothetical protein